MKIAIWGIIAILTFFAGMLFGATAFSGKTLVRKNVVTFGRRVICIGITLVLVAICGLSIWRTAAASNARVEALKHQEELDKAAAEAEAMESQTATEPASEDAGDETKETEEPEPETEEPDWASMDADYLSDKATMDNGAIRALEMTERDMHRFDEEYGRTASISSTNDMMIYRIAHAEDEYAFSNSILVNFADRWYFEDHVDDLEYFYAVDSDDIDPDSKVFVKARAEMKDKYAEWRKEFEELKPENNDYEKYARSNFKEELLHNPLATVAWYELMARHSVFTQNNPWIKENLEAMHKAYKLDPKVAETVGTATFLTFSEEHKEDEEECDYTHIISNDEMWEYMCYGARMFELTERTGFKQLNSKIRWGIDIDDDYPDLTKPLLLDKKEDQTSGYFDAYSVKVDGKVVVYFGMHCSDNGLAEFDISVPKKKTTTTTTTKKTPDYGLAVVYIEKATGAKISPDFIWPTRLKEKDPYGPFTKEIPGYTLLSTEAETKGFMPAADHIVYVYYKKNGAPSNDNNNPGGGDPGSKPDPEPGKPKPKPEGSKPKDDKDSSENQPDDDQGRGDNDNQGDGDAEQGKPPAQDTKPSGGEQSGSGGSSGDSESSDNTNHEGEGKDDAANEGGKTTVTEPSGDGDGKTSDPSKDKSTGHTDGGF